MFEGFVSAYLSDQLLSWEAGDSQFPTIKEFLKNFGGCSFNNGIYRIFSASSVDNWNAVVSRTFPKFNTHISCFGVDWLGRIFAVDDRRVENGAPGVVMFEPGTGDALEVPCNILTFHEEELIECREEALAESFYLQWITCGGATPLIDQCVGYKNPLFLGGLDVVDNLEISDLDIYWEIFSRLILQSRGVAVGSKIGNVSIGS
ncbi:DUF1851 domain-containing protein [Achromobacter pestifer]|uniref:DUF1851 domain-containing protein n=1 Tax=Achromobacter pestifer TaxID=1353889 RepID=A0A6S6Z3E7_9BURK|nr:DUF1851 domain-containing protein [Achromobacter pestifer]CAB3649079.1 hypothetical protein LMG3431_02714 [Achromobacter pestifer]